MGQIHVAVSAEIDAPPQAVYSILADYRHGHPSILPKPYFADLTVEQGGQGAGTVLRVEMNVYGAKRSYHLTVSEPEPGRVLRETDSAQGVTTTFTVEPLDGGRRSRATIATDSQVRGGVGGWMERLINPPVTRRIYRAELDNLAAAARQISTTATLT